MNQATTQRIIIVGGVAGGMSCAARIKRLDDTAEVTVFEKGQDVSFANCGMPYYIGGVITDRQRMHVQTPDALNARYGLDVRVRHEVTQINRQEKQIQVKNLDTGETHQEAYDKLVLSPGAAPFRPPIPGADGDNVFVLNDLADMDAIHEATAQAKQVVIVGGGFIGLELAENFVERGLTVAMVEMLDQVMGPMDREMTQPILQALQLRGVDVHLSETVTAIEEGNVVLQSGEKLPADFVCLSIGVRPTSQLAKDAGLNLGPRGHIQVNEHMETNDPHIYAVGDVVEVKDWVTGDATAVPLAGPANRQGRIAADHICGIQSAYRGTQGTAIVKVLNLAAAQTGTSEKRLRADNTPYHRIYINPMQHPGYYPGAQAISIKLLFSPEGTIYGAQVVGPDGVQNIIDILATAMRGKQTVQDLEHLELAYAPQWGGAKHGINMAGFVATNVLNGTVQLTEPDAIPEDVLMLDVRTTAETETAKIPGALNIPVDELRDRYEELPKEKKIVVYCAVGQRGYVATRLLMQKGFDVSNLNGGYRTWTLFQDNSTNTPKSTLPATEERKTMTTAPTQTDTNTRVVKLDVCGLQCPGPIGKVKETMATMQAGEVLEVISSDPGFAADIPMWCKATKNTLISIQPDKNNYRATIACGTDADIDAGSCSIESNGEKKGTTLVCFSNDLDKALATFIIANGAASMNKDVTIFFTFWGLSVLRQDNPPHVKKSLLDRMFGWMLPLGAQRLKLSKMNMGGMGTAMMGHVMKTKNVFSLPELIQQAQDNGVKLVACAMSMDIMGIMQEELIDGVEIAGVGHYLGTASESDLNLFV